MASFAPVGQEQVVQLLSHVPTLGLVLFLFLPNPVVPSLLGNMTRAFVDAEEEGGILQSTGATFNCPDQGGGGGDGSGARGHLVNRIQRVRMRSLEWRMAATFLAQGYMKLPFTEMGKDGKESKYGPSWYYLHMAPGYLVEQPLLDISHHKLDRFTD